MCWKKKAGIEELFLLPSIPPSREDSSSSSAVRTWPLTFVFNLTDFRRSGISMGEGKQMQMFRATKPRLLFDHSHPPQRRSSHQFLTHVNGPLQYLMFLYGVLTIECRNGMHIWLLLWVRIHLPNRAMHSDVEREDVMKARANSTANSVMFYPRWTQVLKRGWSICSRSCRYFADATQATVVCGES